MQQNQPTLIAKRLKYTPNATPMRPQCDPQDSATAKKLAFSKDVERRCVTLEGDDFNPKGLLTGGARQQVRAVCAVLYCAVLCCAVLCCVWVAAGCGDDSAVGLV